MASEQERMRVVMEAVSRWPGAEQAMTGEKLKEIAMRHVSADISPRKNWLVSRFDWDAIARELTSPAAPREQIERIVEEGHCNDTCSNALSPEYACDCWKAKIRAALSKP